MRMNGLALAMLAALGIGAAALAQQRPGGRPGQPATQPRSGEQTTAPRGGDRTAQVPFEVADRNADGRLSRQEANEIEGVDFSRADTNNDSSLSREEYQGAMATSAARDRAGPASARSGDAAGNRSGGAAPGRQQRERHGDDDTDRRQAQVTFDAADKNSDGRISRDEARDVDGLNFRSADTNDDDSLSRQEFQVAISGRQPRG